MNREPVLTTATVVTLVTAIVTLVAAFGVDVSDKQAAAIVGVVTALGTIVGAIYARSKVTPVP
jgi:hypothetical protein